MNSVNMMRRMIMQWILYAPSNGSLPTTASWRTRRRVLDAGVTLNGPVPCMLRGLKECTDFEWLPSRCSCAPERRCLGTYDAQAQGSPTTANRGWAFGLGNGSSPEKNPGHCVLNSCSAPFRVLDSLNPLSYLQAPSGPARVPLQSELLPSSCSFQTYTLPHG